MSHCISHIKLTDRFHLSDLVSRDLADEIFQHVALTGCPEVEIDFSGIVFISRAFADQFHKLKTEARENGKTVVTVNLSEEVKAMLQAVAATQGEFGRTYRKVPVLRFDNRRELKEFLFSF